MLKKTNLISLCLVSSLANAQPASLNAELNLQIPLIQLQTGTQNQFYWADLRHSPTAENSLTYIVSGYGEVASDSVPPGLHKLESVTEGAAPVILDITASQARLHFISQIPLACSVIYGENTEFGNIATDSNMNGSAIIEHNPVLTGLKSESTYYYRVQGTDAQGKLYWGPVASFTTASSTDSTNLNLLSISNGAIVSAVSSNYGGGNNQSSWGANNAFDDSEASAWSSANDGDAAYIEVTLAENTLINTAQVWSRSMTDGSAKILTFNLILDDNETLGPFTLPDTQQAYAFDININTTKLRLDVISSTGGNTGLIEFSAY